MKKYKLTTLGKIVLTSSFWILVFIIFLQFQKLHTNAAIKLLDMPADSVTFSVQFSPNDTVVIKQDYATLKKVADFALHNNELEVYAVGHAPDTGESESDLRLAARRARAVAEYLQFLGVQSITSAGRISDDGLSSGESNRVIIYIRNKR